MKIKIVFFLFILFSSLCGQTKIDHLGGKPGAFSRMGFGSRGISMGNALSSVISGNLSSYYNPAVIPFQEGNSVYTAYSFLSLDRSLNYISFTKSFLLKSRQTADSSEAVKTGKVGFSAGIINAGVSNIEKRDNNGELTGNFSTSENQFFIALSNRFSDKLSVGVAFKFHYYKLYEDITAGGLGFDLGFLYRLNDRINISFVLSDLNSKYRWDSSPLYGLNGINQDEKFPTRKKLGVSYQYDDKLLASVEYENNNTKNHFLRAGAEYNVYEKFFLRGGIDMFDISNTDIPVRPSLGFSYYLNYGSMDFGVDYAFAVEPYSGYDRHIIGLNFIF